MTVCTLQLTQQQYDAIRDCESVVVCEYEREDGSRFAELIDWGDETEMEDVAKTPRLAILPTGISVVCQIAVPVSELIE